jgi:hypothetical protein
MNNFLPFVLYGCLSHQGKHGLMVHENRLLLRIFGPKKDAMTGGWRKLKMKNYISHTSPDSIRVIKSKRMRWAGHVTQIRRWQMCPKVWLLSLHRINYSVAPGVDV